MLIVFGGWERHIPYVIATYQRCGIIHHLEPLRLCYQGCHRAALRGVVTVEAIPTAPGYRFVEWADNDEAPAIRTFAVTDDLALEAYFEEIDQLW